MVKLTRKTLGKSFHHWYYGNLTCFSQEHMQTFGYLASMLPVVEELYKDKEEQAKAMQTYTAFFKTTDRKSVVQGKSVDLGGRRIIKKKIHIDRNKRSCRK